MLKLWKWSAGIFVLQAIVFVIARYFFDLPIEYAFFVVAATAVATAVATGIAAAVAFAAAGVAAAAGVVAFAAFAADAGVAISVAVAVAVAAVVVAAVVVAAFAALAAVIVKDNGAKEPLWALFIAALPFGIGTVLGGILLLHFYFRSEKVTSALVRE